MKLLGSTKSKRIRYENRKNLPHLKIIEVVLIHCNIVKSNHQQDSRVLYTYFPNKSFGQLLNISHKKLIFLKNSDSEFSFIEVWFTDENSKPLVIDNKINITLAFN